MKTTVTKTTVTKTINPVAQTSAVRTSRTVADVMTRHPRTAHPGMSLDVVIQTLAKFHLSGLPVVNERSEVIGMVSEFDLMWQESGVTPPPYLMILDSVIYFKNPLTYDRDLHKALGRTVEEVMSSHPITITADKTVADAARVMHDRHIHRIPVVDANRKLIGIITQGDVIQAMAKEISGSSRDRG
jgi:CBS domain-containing protein